jgi:hypothetical protein
MVYLNNTWFIFTNYYSEKSKNFIVPDFSEINMYHLENKYYDIKVSKK